MRNLTRTPVIPAIVLLLLVGRAFADEPVGSSSARDSQSIQGVWTSVSVEGVGVSRVKRVRVVVAEKTIVIRVDNKVVVEAKYSLDAKRTPKAIDLLFQDRSTLGIYELKGNTLRLSLGNANLRPTTFAGSDDCMFLVLDRQSPGVVDLGGMHATDADLKRELKGTANATTLILGVAEITDAGLEHLEGMTNLRWLSLDGDRKITDAGLKHLRGLTNLELLSLDSYRITDAGLENLKGLTNLKYLSVRSILKGGGKSITDAGLLYFKGMAKLENLFLSQTSITDNGLERLAGLTNLEELDLGETHITDAGLRHLNRLSKLRRLDLFGTRVTDAGLEHLKRVKQLRQLVLKGTQVTDAGVSKLQEELPKCTIER